MLYIFWLFLPSNHCRWPQQQWIFLRDVTVHIMTMTSACVQDVSPGVPPGQSKPADSLYVNGWGYNVLWLRSWPTKHPEKWQSYVYCSKWHSFIIAISKQVNVWLSYSRGLFLKSRSGGLTRIFLSLKTLWELKSYVGDRWIFFRQKCVEESVGQVGGQTGGQTLLHIQLPDFFPHCQRQLQLVRYLYLVL